MISLKPGEVCGVENCPYCDQKDASKYGCLGKDPNRKNAFRCSLNVSNYNIPYNKGLILHG